MATPEGWYREPDDQAMLRYWDGSQWTADRQLTAETATRSDNADISGTQPARLDGRSGSIDLRDEAVVLTWPDKWSLHSDRKAASPRTIPLSAIRDVEVIQKVTGNSLRVHLHGEPSDAKYKPTESINALELHGSEIEAARQFASHARELASSLPSSEDPSLLETPTQRAAKAKESHKAAQRLQKEDDRRLARKVQLRGLIRKNVRECRVSP